MFSLVALLLAPLGTDVVAGHQIALNVVSIFFMVPMSIGLAITLRISFLIGAEQPKTARLVARSTIIMVTAISFCFAALMYSFARPIASLYSTEVDVLLMAELLLGYGAMFQIADVLQVVCISGLRGYKDTRIPMYIMLSSFWVFCHYLAWDGFELQPQIKTCSGLVVVSEGSCELNTRTTTTKPPPDKRSIDMKAINTTKPSPDNGSSDQGNKYDQTITKQTLY